MYLQIYLLFCDLDFQTTIQALKGLQIVSHLVKLVMNFFKHHLVFSDQQEELVPAHLIKLRLYY